MADSPALLGRGAFVGREAEMEQLTAGLDEARVGRGRLFLVSGEPGIGKSRLAEELAARAREGGFRVLWGRCWEEGGAPAYWPWVQCIRSLLRGTSAEATSDLGDRADLAPMVPELRRKTRDTPDPVEPDPEAARFRLFDSASSFLRDAGQTQPLAVLLDDLHAADEPSLLFLRFLAAELGEAPLLLLGTYRDTAIASGDPLTTTLAELARRGAARRIALRGLSGADIASYIEVTWDVTPSGELVETIREETEGNPLFVAEIVRLLVAEGGLRRDGLPGGPGAIPAGIREAIARRLGKLSDRCRDVLTVASVLGRDFGVDALQRATGLSTDELLELLDEAMVARVIGELPGGMGRLRFSHALVRDAIYDEIPAARRMRLHGRLGEILERLHAGDLDSHASEIARHFLEAAPGEQADRAVEYARRAGDNAVRLLAWEEAVRLYRAASDALEVVEGPVEELRCELMLAVGDALTKAGDFPQAREMFLRAVQVARRMGSSSHLARATLGYGGRFVWLRAGDDHRVVPLLQEALEELGPGDSDLRVRVLSRLSGALRDDPDRGPRDELSLEAVQVARRLGDPDTLAYALVARYTAIWGPDNTDDLLEIATEVVELARRLGDRDRLLEGTLIRHKALMNLGDLDAARSEHAAATRLAEELRQPAQTWYVAADRATLALLEARLDEAEVLVDRALEIGERSQPMEARATEAVQRWALRREQGRLAEAERVLRRASEDFPWYPHFRCGLANLYAELGEVERAGALVADLARERFSPIPVDNEWLFALCLAAEPVAAVAETETVAALSDLLAPFASLSAYSAPELYLGPVTLYLGLLAARLGRQQEAERHLQDAVLRSERTGAATWVVRSRYHLADVLRRGDPSGHERAGEVAEAARETARRAGLRSMEERLAALIDDLGEGPPTEAVPAGRPTFRREGEYWSIAFEGRAFRLKDTKGLHHLARLLAAPGREVHALDLVTAGQGTGGPAKAHPSAEGLTVGRMDTGDEVLDRQARESYRTRLAELEEEIEEARAWADPERAARAEEERDAIIGELGAAMGLGGRSRKTATAAERARVNATRAIRAALDRIAEHDRSLGDHLAATVSTGLYCSYRPDPRAPVAWDVGS
jgi:tetratricopeptide (TPR) repeat protein